MKRAALGAAWVVAMVVGTILLWCSIAIALLATSIHDHIVEPIDAARNRLDK